MLHRRKEAEPFKVRHMDHEMGEVKLSALCQTLGVDSAPCGAKDQSSLTYYMSKALKCTALGQAVATYIALRPQMGSGFIS